MYVVEAVVFISLRDMNLNFYLRILRIFQSGSEAVCRWNDSTAMIYGQCTIRVRSHLLK